VRCQIAYRRPPQLWRHGNILQESLEHIDRFVALSEFSREKHREFGFPREMSVLPPFVEDDDLAADSAPRPHARPYFLIAGRLERLKGVHEAIAAFEHYEDADLLIAGEGSAESELRAAAATNPRCVFLGKLSPEALRGYYRHAVATIVPSVGFETFGMVIVESFRERTPVIARRIGPFPETIQCSGGGDLFETASEMVESARRIQSDAAYRDKLGEAGYAAYREHWSESKVVPRYLELVADVKAAHK
jgi:glycosyltransferase involved in cell wall biosynthesis